jgi:N-acetylglucosamine kinase-like BadF-type ATPase
MKQGILSIASGHTTTQAFYWAEKSQRTASGQSLNRHYVEVVEASKRLKRIVRKLKLTKDHLENVRVVLTLPGVSTNKDVENGQHLLKIAGIDCCDDALVVDDTVSALIAEFGTFEGISAICGTGASVFVGRGFRHTPSPVTRPNKKDGWGPLLGDFGSGFRLGLEFLSWVCRGVDLNGVPPDLFAKVAKLEPHLRDLNNAQRWFDEMIESQSSAPNWNMRIARLAQVVTEDVARLNEKSAVYDLLLKAAKQISKTIETAKEMIDCRDLPVACHGGMFRYSKAFLSAVQENLSEFAGDVVLAKWRPVFGGLLLGLTDNWASPSPETVAQVKQCLRPKSVSFLQYG